MIVVDSSVWISVIANAELPEVASFLAISDRSQILVGDVILLEVLRGARSERSARLIEEDLRRFNLVRMIDAAIASKAAANYRLLRARSVTIRNTVDLIIGTYCMEHGHQLLHRDRDFDHMQQLGLKLCTG